MPAFSLTVQLKERAARQLRLRLDVDSTPIILSCVTLCMHAAIAG
jgi:hypothetical protein